MKFGVGLLTAQNPQRTEQSYEQVYEDTLDLAVLAEEVGFDSVWTSEHHFWDDGYSPSVLPLCAAIAAATDEITIGTAVALGPFYDPVRFAEDAATIDQLSGGRFLPGVANGYMPHEFEGFGIPIEERAPRVEELLEVYKSAMSNQAFSYDGRFNTYQDIHVTPPPVQDGGPPLLLGGTSEPAVDRAARLADGHIGFMPIGGSATGGHGYSIQDDTSQISRETLIKKFVDDVEYVARESDKPRQELEFVALDSGFIAETDDEAWEQVYEWTTYSGKQYARHYNQEEVTMDHSDEAREIMRQHAMVGSPETIIDRLRAYEELFPEWGEPHVIVLDKYPGLGYDAHASALRRFGETVLPEFS